MCVCVCARAGVTGVNLWKKENKSGKVKSLDGGEGVQKTDRGVEMVKENAATPSPAGLSAAAAPRLCGVFRLFVGVSQSQLKCYLRWRKENNPKAG